MRLLLKNSEKFYTLRGYFSLTIGMSYFAAMLEGTETIVAYLEKFLM
jgi:hypothetical protein